MFSTFGNIVDIIAKRNIRMRGQAFIIYQDISSAIEAVKEMQDYSFYQKPMVITFFLKIYPQSSNFQKESQLRKGEIWYHSENGRNICQ